MRRLFILLFSMFLPLMVYAAGNPAVQDPGVSEKALRQSQPDYTPRQDDTPELIESDTPEVSDASGPAFFVNQIMIEGNTLLPEAVITDIVEMGDGRELNLGELKLMVNRITRAYTEAGYFLVRAYLPPQEITDGRVTINILQGQIANISASGNEFFASNDITASLVGIADSTMLTESQLEHFLLNLNDVYGVTARGVMKPGTTTGTTDMVVNVEESRPYKISLDADNFGSVFTGENRYGVSALAGSVFKFGDEVNFRGITSNGNQDYLNVAYRLPVIGLNTYLEASYVYSNQQLGSNLTVLQAKGDSNIATLGLSHYWQRTRTHEIAFDAGVSVRLYKNEQLATKTSDDRLVNLFIGVNGFFNDRFRARTYYDVKLQTGLTERDQSDPFNSRLNGRGNALIASMSLTRYQGVPLLDSYLVLKLTGQIADRRVLSPDLYAAGGMGTVRGYPLAEISGDNAIFLSSEYIVPVPFKKTLIDGLPPVNEMLSLFAFIDHSTTFANQRVSGEVDQSITGAGFGLRVNIEPDSKQLPNIDFMAAYAAPVLGSQTPSDDNNSVFYLGVVMTY
jgi:hemolysin activation/secretion protein